MTPGVTVELTGADGIKRAATTDAGGRDQIGGLPAGRYEVRAMLAGFRPVVRTAEVALLTERF